MNTDNTYDVGIYLRLSKDDNNGHYGKKASARR